MSNSLIILNVLHSHSTSTKCSSPQGASKAVVDTWTHSKERHTNKLTQRNALLYITTSRASYSITRRIVSFLFWSVVFYGLHFTSWQRSNLTIHRPYISFLFFFSRQLTPTGHDVHQFVIFAEKQLGTEKRTKKVVAKVELKVSSTFFGISWGKRNSISSRWWARRPRSQVELLSKRSTHPDRHLYRGIHNFHY